MIRAEVEDLVDRVEPQRVDMVLGQPVQRIVDEEAPYPGALRTVEIDRGAPWCSITVGKVWAILAKVVSFRAQMVVDDVQHHRETFVMTSVDEPLEPEVRHTRHAARKDRRRRNPSCESRETSPPA